MLYQEINKINKIICVLSKKEDSNQYMKGEPIELYPGNTIDQWSLSWDSSSNRDDNLEEMVKFLDMYTWEILHNKEKGNLNRSKYIMRLNKKSLLIRKINEKKASNVTKHLNNKTHTLFYYS